MYPFLKDKRALREQFRALRAESKSEARDTEIARRFFSSAFFCCFRSFFVYLSVNTETDTRRIIRGIQAAGKEVCVPLVDGKTMRCVPLAGDLARGAYGIEQPAHGEETTCGVALVPLIAADRAGNRLGYGGGYYDKYFAEHPEVLRLGIGYHAQLTEELPQERTDVPLDAYLSEEGFVCFSARADKLFKENKSD